MTTNTTPFKEGDEVTWTRHTNTGTTTRRGTIEWVTPAEAAIVDAETDALTYVMLDRLSHA